MKPLIFFLLSFISLTVFSQNEGIIQIDASPQIRELANKRISYNKSKTRIDGYRIQIYYGSENGAVSARNKFLELFPNTAVTIDYQAPDWKVRVGNYKTRLEADKAREEIVMVFDGAFVLKEKIPKK